MRGTTPSLYYRRSTVTWASSCRSPAHCRTHCPVSPQFHRKYELLFKKFSTNFATSSRIACVSALDVAFDIEQSKRRLMHPQVCPCCPCRSWHGGADLDQRRRPLPLRWGTATGTASIHSPMTGASTLLCYFFGSRYGCGYGGYGGSTAASGGVTATTDAVTHQHIAALSRRERYASREALRGARPPACLTCGRHRWRFHSGRQRISAAFVLRAGWKSSTPAVIARKIARARERLPHPAGRVSRLGAIPRPTVTVRISW